MTFRHTFGQVTFDFPGNLFRERVGEGFLELFDKSPEGSSLNDIGDDTAAPTLTAASITATPGSEDTSVKIALSFFDTRK